MRNLFIAFFVALTASGCVAQKPFSTLPEPYKSSFAEEIRDNPNSTFSKACHGDSKALHYYFTQADQPLDGAAGEGFTASMIAIQSYMGKDAFYDALRKEPVKIQKAVSECAFAQDFIPST